MRARALTIVVALVALPVAGVAPAGCARAAGAQDANTAGLVVQFSDERVRRFCVSFAEESITGFELLRRTGLPVSFQDYGGGEVTICRIDDVGCDHPSEPCFCECESVTQRCTFWGFYRVDDETGEWRFSEVGAGRARVRDGALLGWRWGSHGEEGGAPPRAADLDGVCARGEQVSGRADERAPRREATQGVPVFALAMVGVLLLGLAALAVRAGRGRGA